MILADICEFYSEEGGGVRTYIQQKLAASAQLGVSSLIIAPGKEDRVEIRQGGKIIWVKCPVLPFDPRYHIFWDMKPVFEVLDREKPHVVEGSSAWRGGWIAARWPGPAVKSFFIHQDPVAVYPQTFLGTRLGTERVDQLFGWFWRYMGNLARHYDLSVVSGAWLADKLARFGLKRPIVVPFGLERSDFSPQLRDPALRAQMLHACGIDDKQASLLVAVSRHHPEKRLGVLFGAIDALRAERPVGLYVIGDGPIRQWVDAQARKVPGIHIAGPIRDRNLLARSMASADAMLHGGAAETFGLVLAEAMCAGLPLIVPDSGGALDLADPAYAIVYATGNKAACAEAIRQFWRADRQALSQAAVQASRTRLHEPNVHFEKLFAAYENALLSRKAV